MPHVFPAVGVPQRHGLIPQNPGYYYTNGRGRNLWSTSPFNINTPANPTPTTPVAPAGSVSMGNLLGINQGNINPVTNAASQAANVSQNNNPFSIDQFKQMYSQNPALAMRMYGADNQAGGRNTINSAMNWSPSQANQIINQYGPGGGNGYNPNQGFTPSGQAYSLAPGSNVNMGALQKFLATGNSKTYQNASQVPGLTMYGSQFNAQPGSYMANLNSNSTNNTAPTGGMPGYTGFGNTMEKGPAPSGPTNLPPNSGTTPFPGPSTYSPGNSTSAGTPTAPSVGAPPPPVAGGGGVPSIGPPNVNDGNPGNLPGSSGSKGLYSGTNISNNNYNNRFGNTFRPV